MCDSTSNDCGHNHHNECYCDEDQGSGYTYSDEYGPCEFCLGNFQSGTIICTDPHNVMRICPDSNLVGVIDPQ